MTSRDTRANLALLVLSALLFSLLFEGIARLLVQPSPRSYGTLLGRDLPPLRVIPPRLPDAPATAPSEEKIGWLDLQGPFREDPVCGYAPLERATSPHGWWTTNDIGARSATDTAPRPAPGVRRVLVFGESFASGSRVQQNDAWPSVLAATAGLEVVNLAVDGYGMGQSLLRFRQIAPGLEYDTALLVFVPSTDLWRDVNTSRRGGMIKKNNGALSGQCLYKSHYWASQAFLRPMDERRGRPRGAATLSCPRHP